MLPKTLSKAMRSIIFALWLSVATAPAQSNEAVTGIAPVEPNAAPLGQVVGADVGTGYNILQIPAAAFSGTGSSVEYSPGGNGYIFSPNTAGDVFWAPVFLPSGAAIEYLNLYAYDTAASSTITATLKLYTGLGSFVQCVLCPVATPPSSSDVVSVSSIGSNGFQYVSSNQLSPPHTVNNNVAYGGGAQYTVLISTGTLGPSLRFKSVDIWWKRQISPAPGVASFVDVPTSAQFFAEIEAMKAAGVTLGCTATEYCPDSNVTRRQMAAFFARALGLYWQY